MMTYSKRNKNKEIKINFFYLKNQFYSLYFVKTFCNIPYLGPSTISLNYILSAFVPGRMI